MDILTIGRKVLKATLEADATYRSLLAYPDVPGVYRTFGEQVHASVPMPYVTIEHYSGGLENDAQTEASDSLWKVCIHTEDDEALALEGSSAIHNALHRKMPVMGDITGYKGYHFIELIYPHTDRYPRQSVTFLKYGGIYRLRLAEIKQG